MGLKFNAAEVLDLGVQIEKNGKVFYEAASKSAKAENARVLFEHLAKEEDHHLAAFLKMAQNAEKSAEPETYEGEYADYVRMLAGDNVFTKADAGKRASEHLKDDSAIIEAALKFEKDSVILFQGMLEGMPERDRKLVEEMVKEALKHIKHPYILKKTCAIK